LPRAFCAARIGALFAAGVGISFIYFVTDGIA
jgi:hypothetical protein